MVWSRFVEIEPGGTLTPAVDLIVDESGIAQNIVLLRFYEFERTFFS